MSSRLVLLTTLLIGTSIILVGCASGGRGPGPGGPAGGMQRRGVDMPEGYVTRPIALVFTAMERDGNGLISRIEAEDGALREWKSATSDRGTTLSASQYNAWAASALGSPDALPSRLTFDTDLDGVISEVEFLAGFRREFEALDKNEDGRLSRLEMIFELPQMRMAQGMGGGMGGGGGGRGPGSGSGDRPPPR